MIRPKAWVALLCTLGVFGGGWTLFYLPNPFLTAGDDARLLKALMTAWVLAGALAGAAAFRLLAWTVYCLTSHSLQVRRLLGGKTFAWADLVSITRKPAAGTARVLELRFKSGKVRLLLGHYAPADIAALEARAKATT